jgi:NAD(P)-dependent dehydrogenase (short-subunit alcohol dehydrogenase family)
MSIKTERNARKVWLITGSSRGLGRALVEGALQAGHVVVAGARKPDDVASQLASHSERALAVRLDVTSPAECACAVSRAIDVFGRLDVVVNNAGYANVGSVEDLPADDFRAQMETNFFGVVNVTRAALPVLHKQRSGHLIQVSSIGGRGAVPGLSAYQAAKWAVGGFSEVLAQEVRPLGIKVTVAEPGSMKTDWAGASMRIHPIAEDYSKTVGQSAGRFSGELRGAGYGDPAKVAQALLRLAEMPDPPVRLLLGSDAVLLAEVFAASRRREDVANRDLSNSTDFDGLPPFAETEMGRTFLAGQR